MGDSVPVGSAEERQKFVTEMESFVEKECSEIGEILAQMSWTPDHILKTSSMAQCPYDPSHEVPESSLKQHASVCHLRKKGLAAHDVDLQLQDDDFFYENADLVGKVLLDEGLLNRIIWNHCMEHGQVHMGHRLMPVSADDWSVKLSPQERLAVYDYCVQTLKAEGKMANVEKDEVLTTDWERIIKKGLLDQGGERPTSKVELLAMLRDQKRRRQSYRAKNVHVTKKSYTEIIREVILSQMEIMMPTEEKEKKNKQEETDAAQEKHSSVGGHHYSPSLGQDYSRNRSRSHSPREKKSRSESSSRRRSHFNRSRSPHRKRSRSQSPRDRSGRSFRHKRDDSFGSRRADDPDVERRHSSHMQKSQQDCVEGQFGSEDSSYGQEHQHRSKKKSSKHKKHKHKKHKSKSYHSDSEDGH